MTGTGFSFRCDFFRQTRLFLLSDRRLFSKLVGSGTAWKRRIIAPAIFFCLSSNFAIRLSRELPSLNARSFPLRKYLGELPRQMCSTRLASADNWRPLRTPPPLPRRLSDIGREQRRQWPAGLSDYATRNWTLNSYLKIITWFLYLCVGKSPSFKNHFRGGSCI